MTLALLLGTRAIAQTNTLETQPLPVTSVCPGSTIEVTGFRNYPSADIRVELSNGGSYYEIPSELIDGNRFEIKYQVTIPGNTPAGTNYRIRMVSKNPDLAGIPSSTTLTVKAATTAPTTASATYCQGTAASALSATASTGGILIWYGSASGGNSLPGAPTPSTASPGVATYYVSQSINGACESPRATVQATIQPTPSAPSISQSTYSICQNSPTQSLSAVGQNLKWYETPTGGTSVSAVTPSSSTVGTKSYYVSQTTNGCESSRTTLTVSVQEVPAAPTISQTSYTACQGGSAIISATVVSGISTIWTNYGDSPAPTNTSVNNNVATAIIPTDQARTMTYSLAQTSSNGCKGPSSVTVSVTVKATPSAPSVQSVSVCQGGTAPTLQANGQGLLWYTNSSGGTGSSVTPVVSTSQAGQFNYYVTQSQNGCESVRAVLPVFVNSIPAAPSLTSPIISVCQYTPVQTLAANGQNLKWYDVATGGNALASTPQSDPSTPSSKIYYVSQTVGSCEGPRASLTVTVRRAPDAPSPVKSDYEFCEGELQPVISFALPAATDSKRWVIFKTSSKETFFEATTTNTTLVVNVPNLFSPASASATSSVESYGAFVMDITGCASTTSSPINVKTKARPSSPATSELSICQNAPSQSLAATGQNLLWYTTGSGGVGSSVAPTVNTGQAGQTTYYVSQTRDGCEGPRNALSVTIKALPTAPGVTPRTICAMSPSEQATASGENLTWYTSDGTKLGSAPTINTDRGTSYSLLVTQTVNGCEGPKASLQINVISTPIPAVAKAIVELCQGSPPQALSATGTNLKWTEPNGNVTSVTPMPSTNTPTARPDGDEYSVTQTVNGCESTKASIRVFVQATPKLTLSQSTTTNIGLDVPLKLIFTGVGPYQYKLSNNIAGTATKDTTISVAPAQTTTYQVLEITNKCGAGPTGIATAITVTVLVPTIRTLALNSTTLCVGTQLTTNFQTTGTFNTGSVFKLQVAKVETDTTKMVYLDVPVSQTANGQLSGLISNTLPAGNYAVRVIATNPKIPINGSASPTTLTIRPLATASLTGNPTVYEGQPARLTVVLTGDAPWSFSYRDSTSAGLGGTMTIQTSTNPHSLEVRPTRTSTYLLTGVSNGCGTGAVVSRAAIVTVTPLLGIEDQLLVDAVDVFPIPTSSMITVRIRGLTMAQPATLELTDLNGRIVHQQEARLENTSISLESKPTGTYLLRIRVGDRTAAKRIVKQ
ncbi:hypothetical protein GCM10027592_54580 [Spirosoma flavus]